MAIDRTAVAIRDLVADTLGLDPAALARMADKPAEAGVKQSEAAVWTGLNRFARKVMATYLALADQDGAAVRLKDEPGARANGWPDEQTANVAMILVWGLLIEDRESKELSQVQLFDFDRKGDPLDPVLEGVEGMSATELCRMVLSGSAPTKEMSQQRKRGIAPPAAARTLLSTNAAIWRILGLEPGVLNPSIDPWKHAEPGDVDQDTLGRLALNGLVRSALRHHLQLSTRRADNIRLMTEWNTQDGSYTDVSTANFALLLSAALMCEEGWQVAVFRALGRRHTTQPLTILFDPPAARLAG